MNHLPESVEYIRATKIIRFGFGVSGDDNVPKGSVAKILERHTRHTTHYMYVSILGIGERNIHTPDIEAITEKEYFKSALRG